MGTLANIGWESDSSIPFLWSTKVSSSARGKITDFIWPIDSGVQAIWRSLLMLTTSLVFSTNGLNSAMNSSPRWDCWTESSSSKADVSKRRETLSSWPLEEKSAILSSTPSSPMSMSRWSGLRPPLMSGVADAESFLDWDDLGFDWVACILKFRPTVLSSREEVGRFCLLYSLSKTELVPVEIDDIDRSSAADGVRGVIVLIRFFFPGGANDKRRCNDADGEKWSSANKVVLFRRDDSLRLSRVREPLRLSPLCNLSKLDSTDESVDTVVPPIDEADGDCNLGVRTELVFSVSRSLAEATLFFPLWYRRSKTELSLLRSDWADLGSFFGVLKKTRSGDPIIWTAPPAVFWVDERVRGTGTFDFRCKEDSIVGIVDEIAPLESLLGVVFVVDFREDHIASKSSNASCNGTEGVLKPYKSSPASDSPSCASRAAIFSRNDGVLGPSEAFRDDMPVEIQNVKSRVRIRLPSVLYLLRS